MQGSRPYPIGIHPKDSSYATPQCPPWARDSVLVNGLSDFQEGLTGHKPGMQVTFGVILVISICYPFVAMNMAPEGLHQT